MPKIRQDFEQICKNTGPFFREIDYKLSKFKGFVKVVRRPKDWQWLSAHLHGFNVVSHVEVGVSQLAVDGAECPEVVCPGLKGGLEKGHPVPAVAGLAKLLTLKSKLKAGVGVTAILNTGKNWCLKWLHWIQFECWLTTVQFSHSRQQYWFLVIMKFEFPLKIVEEREGESLALL